MVEWDSRQFVQGQCPSHRRRRPAHGLGGAGLVHGVGSLVLAGDGGVRIEAFV